MESSANIIKNKSIAELVKEAREQSGRISSDEEKKSKDLGGILVPSAFQVPNEIIDDNWLKELNGSEVKVLLFIIRKTFGFNKIAGDKIPLSQIQGGTGLSKPSALDAIKVLEACNLIRVKRGRTEDGMRQINYYQLITRLDYNRPK